MFVQVGLVVTWNCWISCKNGHTVLLVLHLLPLLNLWLIVELQPAEVFSIGITFVDVSSELAGLVPLSYSRVRSTRYSDRLHDFSVTIPKCYKDVYVNSFFPCTAKLWNSLPIECFPLTYDLSGFKSGINRSFDCRFFLNRFPVSFNLFVLLFLITPCLEVAVMPCMG